MRLRTASSLTALVTLGFLAACGGSDDSDESNAAEQPESAAQGSSDADAESEEALQLGESTTITIDYRGQEGSIVVTPNEVTKADMNDLAAYPLEADQAAKDLYYVRAHFENASDLNLRNHGLAGAHLTLEDVNGKQLQLLLPIGPDIPCESELTPDPFPQGATQDTWSMFLGDPNVEVARVRYTDVLSEQTAIWNL